MMVDFDWNVWLLNKMKLCWTEPYKYLFWILKFKGANFIKLVIRSLFMTLAKVMLTLCSIKHHAFKTRAAV